MCCAYASSLETCAQMPTPNDWIPSLDACNLCQGNYQPFYAPIPNFKQHHDLPITLEFEQGELQKEGTSTVTHGTMVQGARRLEAERLSIHRSGDIWNILAQGHLVYHQPNMSIWANRAFFDHDNHYGKLDCSVFRWYPRHARANSQSVEVYEQSKIVLNDSSFTTCAPWENTWQIQAEKITLYPQTGRARAKHMVLTAKDFPIFYWPYLDYPIDDRRHSGFLFPSYGSSSQSGIAVSIPYYFNLATNYDLILSLKGYQKRGAGAQSYFRYLTQHSHGSFNLDYVADDHAYQHFRSQTLQALPTGYTTFDPRVNGLRDHDYRLGFVWDHHVVLAHRWSIDIDYHRVSDDNYFVDLGNDIHTTSTLHLPQRISAYYSGKHWHHTFRAEDYQVLQPFKGAVVGEVYRRQPQWHFQARYPQLWEKMDVQWQGEAVRFAHPGDPVTGLSRIEGQRYHIQPAVRLPWQRTWFELTPTFYADFLQYDLKQPSDLSTSIQTAPSRTTPILTLDGRLWFERMFSWQKQSLIQTLSPRLFYTYIPYRNQQHLPNFDGGIIQFSYAQLYRYNRFSGVDRLNEANQISASLNSSILSADDQFEWMRMGIGEIFYFTPEQVFLCDPQSPTQLCSLYNAPRHSRYHSNLLSELAFAARNGTKWGAFVEWSLEQSLIQQASLYFHTKLNNHFLVSANYYFTRNDPRDLTYTQFSTGHLNQGDISMITPLTHRIHLITRLHYDFDFHQWVEMLGGIEYDSCCFAAQIGLSRYRQLGNAILGREFNNQVMVQFVFKGLSSIGSQLDDNLKQRIPGYTPLSERASVPRVSKDYGS